jgi:hypothetical protein
MLEDGDDERIYLSTTGALYLLRRAEEEDDMGSIKWRKGIGHGTKVTVRHRSLINHCSKISSASNLSIDPSTAYISLGPAPPISQFYGPEEKDCARLLCVCGSTRRARDGGLLGSSRNSCGLQGSPIFERRIS